MNGWRDLSRWVSGVIILGGEAGRKPDGGKRMRNSFVLFMIAAIFCALFADKIDMAVKGDKKVKKVIIVFSAGVLLVCTITAIAMLCECFNQ